MGTGFVQYTPSEITGSLGGIDAHTLFLVHGNSLSDSSGNGISVNNSGVSISSSQKKFSAYNSLYFGAGPNSFYIQNLLKGKQPFTIDFWYYTSDTTRQQALWSHGGSNNSAFTGGMLSYSFTSRAWGLGYYCGGNIIIDGNMNYTNAWHHIALVYDGTKFYLFKDGKIINSSTGTMNFTSEVERFGWNDDATNECCYGYMQELRISNIARWTSNFTPKESPYTIGKWKGEAH